MNAYTGLHGCRANPDHYWLHAQHRLTYDVTVDASTTIMAAAYTPEHRREGDA